MVVSIGYSAVTDIILSFGELLSSYIILQL
jgi:hypothetical protein